MPLLSRDFAQRTMVDRMDEHSNGEGHRDAASSIPPAPDSFVVSDLTDSAPVLRPPPPPKQQSKPSDLTLLPPKSVHDTYVSSFIRPMDGVEVTPTQPPTPEAEHNRPMIFRTSSAPGKPTSPGKLLPSPLPRLRTGEGKKPSKEAKVDEGMPIFEIFDADLAAPAHEMVKALKGHLDEVLKVSEEIGRMHLSLERLTVGAGGGWDQWDEDRSPAQKSSVDRSFASGAMQDDRRRESVSGMKGDETVTGLGIRSPGSGEETPGTTTREDAEQALLKREQGVDEIMEKVRSALRRI